jgi:ribosomal protein L11 methyltransferase
MSIQRPHWREITVTLPAAYEESASAFLIGQGAEGVWVESNGGYVHLHVFFPKEEEGRVGAIRKGLRRLVSKGRVALVITLRPEEAWQTAWQKHSIPIQRIGKRLLIGAPWHFPIRNAAKREVIELAPGMAFGTGTHATTKSCLLLLEELIWPRAGGTLLDVGTGSGILAIAGAKLGAEAVTAIEVDPVALSAARKNAKINGTSSKIFFRKKIPSRSRYRWVVANVTAPVLIELSEILTRLVAPGGKLILSGILASEWANVLAHYRPQLTLLRKMRKGEWVTLLLEKRKRSSKGIDLIVRHPG